MDWPDAFGLCLGVEPGKFVSEEVTVEKGVRQIAMAGWRSDVQRWYGHWYNDKSTLDAIHIKLRRESKVENTAVYIVLGVDLEGHRDVLGHWVGDGAEGANFWLSVVSDLQNCGGVKDLWIACMDGLTGFKEALLAVFPKTEIQRCIIHHPSGDRFCATLPGILEQQARCAACVKLLAASVVLHPLAVPEETSIAPRLDHYPILYKHGSL